MTGAPTDQLRIFNPHILHQSPLPVQTPPFYLHPRIGFKLFIDELRSSNHKALPGPVHLKLQHLRQPAKTNTNTPSAFAVRRPGKTRGAIGFSLIFCFF
jgi:hypothetical protein